MPMSMEDAMRVMDAHVDELMAITGVVGVAVGKLDDGTPSIQVLAVKKTRDLCARVPKEIEGYPVVVVESGVIKPLSGDSAR